MITCITHFLFFKQLIFPTKNMQATAHRQPFCAAPGGDKSNYGGYIMGSLRNIQLWAAVYPGHGMECHSSLL